MHTSYWGFVFAMAIGGMSQFIKDAWPTSPAWLGQLLFWASLILAVVSLAMYANERGMLAAYGGRIKPVTTSKTNEEEGSIVITSHDQSGGITAYSVDEIEPRPSNDKK